MNFIQQGSSARIYLQNVEDADEEGAGSVVALKVFREDVANVETKIENEIAALHCLQADNSAAMRFVITLRFIRPPSTDDGLRALGLEYCSRGDLLTLLNSHSLTAGDVPYYAAEIALALSHLAKHNVFHGDLKPENFGVMATGHLRLLDFGHSKILTDDREVVHGAGTLPYASPEVLSREPVTIAGDWWSFGAIVFELTFGVNAFQEATAQRTMSRIMSRGPKWPSALVLLDHVPASQFIAKLLEQDPAQRLSSLQACKHQAYFHDVSWTLVESEAWTPHFIQGFAGAPELDRNE